jgi:AcrR family transcriptional regulator
MLDAAIAVFAEKGFAAATMDEIAERAEFGKGTLYNYFADKQALLFAAIDEVHEGVVALIDAYFADAAHAARPTRAVFRDFLARLLAHFQEQLPVFMMLVREAQRLMLDRDAAETAPYFRQRERVVEAIERPLRAAMERGELRRLPANAVAHLVMGNVQGYLMYAACPPAVSARPERERPAPSADEAAEFIATVLFDGLLPDAAPAGRP